MEESVALDTSKQKQFVKSIKGLKKLIKKNDPEAVSAKIRKAKGKEVKKKHKPRGLVYLAHIPHGFYENEMSQYFKQFGGVTNVRVIRSKRTGNSKGFAFVEFRETAVAEIVAETMNNYLMGKRLIKAVYIPPEKQKRFAPRKRWSVAHNPTQENRQKMKKAYNTNKDDQGELKRARKLLSNLKKTKKNLSELGINYDFFAPVDVPEPLQDLIKKPEVKQEILEVETGKNNKSKKIAKKEPVKVEVVKQDNKNKQNKKQVLASVDKKVNVKSKKEKEPVKVNEKEQKNKEKKLTDAGVKHVENFIKIKEDAEGDSDSSYDFDSDEFEKLLENDDSDILSAEENDESGSDDEEILDQKDDDDDDDDDDNDEDDKDESESEIIPQKKTKALQKVTPAPKVKESNKPKENQQQVKRKANQNPPVAPKKSKFENRNTQKLAKSFKKRN